MTFEVRVPLDENRFHFDTPLDFGFDFASTKALNEARHIINNKINLIKRIIDFVKNGCCHINLLTNLDNVAIKLMAAECLTHFATFEYQDGL